MVLPFIAAAVHVRYEVQPWFPIPERNSWSLHAVRKLKLCAKSRPLLADPVFTAASHQFLRRCLHQLLIPRCQLLELRPVNMPQVTVSGRSGECGCTSPAPAHFNDQLAQGLFPVHSVGGDEEVIRKYSDTRQRVRVAIKPSQRRRAALKHVTHVDSNLFVDGTGLSSCWYTASRCTR
jgi:hypothetical protein